MKRILITGASGFIGRNCLEPLRARGFELHGVSSRPVSADCKDITWHQADLLNCSTIAPLVAKVRPTHLLHLAWIVLPGISYTSPDNLRWVQSSIELVREFAEQGGQRALVTGTCYEYDQSQGMCHETMTPRHPDNYYGIAKNSLQELLTPWCSARGLSFVWPRLFFMYGPHEHPKRLVSSVVNAVLRGEEAPCSHGQQLRDFLYVGDVADALSALVDSTLTGVVNVGSGAAVTLRSLVESIGEQLRQPELVRLGALPARPGETPLVVAETQRLKGELGWSPRYSLADGIAQTIAWWKSQFENSRNSQLNGAI